MKFKLILMILLSTYFCANANANPNTLTGTASGISITTGNSNTATGDHSLTSNTSGNNNSASGANSLFAITTGSNNLGEGYQAGQYASDGVTQNQLSNNSTYLGAQTSPLSNGDTNETVIGYGAHGIGSNTVTIGSTSVTQTQINGNVGIGTSTSTGTLDIANVSTGTTLTSPSSDEINLINLDTTNNNFSDIRFVTKDTSGANIVSSKIAGITTSHTAGSVSGDIAFLTNGSGTASEVMRIKGNNDVAIGTSVPTSQFEVDGSTYGNIFRVDPGNSNSVDFGRYGSGASSIRIGARSVSYSPSIIMGTGYTGVFGTTTNQWYFTDNNANSTMTISGSGGLGTSDFLSINQTGNVGIGSTNPATTLDVTGAIRSSNFSAQSSGTLVCIKTGGAIGYCSGVITGIACTCN